MSELTEKEKIIERLVEAKHITFREALILMEELPQPIYTPLPLNPFMNNPLNPFMNNPTNPYDPPYKVTCYPE